MAYTRTWDAAYEAYPAATDLVSEGDDRIRNFKTDIRERLGKDHYFDIAGTDADHGEHDKVTLRVGSAPTHAADKGILYAKDVSSKAELFYIDEDGDEVQLTSGGNILVEDTAIAVQFSHIGNVTGDQAVTGVGFSPTVILFVAKVTSTGWPISVGVSDGTNHYCFLAYGYGNTDNWDTHCINVWDVNDTARSVGLVKTLDSDGFTITWTSYGSISAEPSEIFAICFR